MISCVCTEMKTKKLKVPVIILSNLGQKSDLERGRKLGVVDYLVKSNTPINDIVKKLQTVLPIKFEHKHVQVHISEKYAKKYFKTIHRFGKVLNETWLSDGCYLCTVEVPAGLYMDFIEDLNKKTHGGVEISLLVTKNGKFHEETNKRI